ncbi:MAG: hypothetical protein ACPLW7_04975 [Minisyncoccia bacterium]|jgi:hypothetical protein
MKKITNILSFFFVVLLFVLFFGNFQLLKVLAEESTTTSTILTTTSTILESNSNILSNEIHPLIKDIDNDNLKQFLSIQEKNSWRLNKLGDFSQENTIIILKAGVVASFWDENNIEISIFDIPFIVNLNKVKIYDQVWNNIQIDEISPGDIVNIYGYLGDDNKTINAISIRDLSVTPLETSIKGTIISLFDKSFIIKTDDNNQTTVNINNESNIIKFVGNNNEKYKNISLNDLKINDLVVIRGIYNSALNTIEAKVIITGNDNRPFFKSSLTSRGNIIRNQIQEIKDLINQIKAQFIIKFK